MRHKPLPQELFQRNRNKLSSLLKPNSIVVIRSNDILPTNADGTLPFIQNSNFYYLTGIEQEESLVILAPDFPDPLLREILFLKETNDEIATWEGHKLTKLQGQQISGIKEIRWNHQFEKTLLTVLAESEHVYLYSNEHIRNANEVETANDRLIKWFKSKYPLYEYERLAPLIYNLRSKKEPEEVKAIEHACQITEHGFRNVLDVIQPGVWEYEIEAEYIYHFIQSKGRGFAYTPIIASGKNACVLHYIENSAQLHDGDLLLMDVGAAYGMYNADMTRTVPVNGRFTKRQRQVYDAVLRVKTLATELLVAGANIPDYHKAVGEIMTEELLELGLLSHDDISKQTSHWPAYKKYFMHGTSHHLGLDVHDVASVYAKFSPGMVLTVEPGIYIPQEGIGIRLEDNILITDKGPQNLMRNIPIHAEEIEDLMNRGK